MRARNFSYLNLNFFIFGIKCKKKNVLTRLGKTHKKEIKCNSIRKEINRADYFLIYYYIKQFSLFFQYWPLKIVNNQNEIVLFLINFHLIFSKHQILWWFSTVLHLKQLENTYLVVLMLNWIYYTLWFIDFNLWV
jgi:hypothetical protein